MERPQGAFLFDREASAVTVPKTECYKVGDVLIITDRGGKYGGPFHKIKRVTVTSVQPGSLELHVMGYGAAWWDWHNLKLRKRDSDHWIKVRRGQGPESPEKA